MEEDLILDYYRVLVILYDNLHSIEQFFGGDYFQKKAEENCLKAEKIIRSYKILEGTSA
jgi:hypothetical protein